MDIIVIILLIISVIGLSIVSGEVGYELGFEKGKEINDKREA